VSSSSRWGDPIWVLDVTTTGQTSTLARINWAIDLPDGHRLTHPVHASLLDALKRFVWTLFVAPSLDAAAYKTSSLQHISQSLRTFIPWMIGNGYSTFAEVDGSALDRYKEDLPALLVKESEADDDPEIGYSTAYNKLLVPKLLWRQGDVLAEARIPSLPEVPWNGASLNALAESIATKARAQIRPIPSEAAVLILNKAYRLIGAPADDVVKLSKVYLEAYRVGRAGKGSIQSTDARAEVAGKAILNFRFSVIAGETSPWRTPISGVRTPTLRTRHIRKASAVDELRALMADIRNACINVIQATTGMRSSELCAIPVGIDPLTGLPSCIEIETTASGHYEVFTIKSLLSKMEDTPRDEEWVIGMRLIGTDELPPAVRALQVLNALLAPWRELTESGGCLLMWFRTGRGLLPVGFFKDPIRPMTVPELAYAVKDFVLRNVDLSGLPDTSRHALEEGDLVPYRESKGTCIRPHQWRKTLAHFVFNTDNRLLPALMMQFKHISMSMTADNYLGHNQAMFRAFDSARAQETATLLYETVTGKSLIAGRMGEQIEQHIAPFREAVAGLSPTGAWTKILSIVIDDGIRLWFAPHGGCMPLSPGKMRCHEVAGTSRWLNREPNYTVREPSLCAGCACFVLDGRHSEFWQDRFIKNWASWKQAERNGQTGDFRVVKDRANQARALLTRLGLDAAPLEAIAEERSYDA
jgi:integrase